MTELTRLIYVSKIDTERLDSDMVSDILTSAKRNNPALGITGMLVCYYDYFVQALEGSEASIDNLFERIRQDRRHSEVRVVEQVDVQERVFADWSMGFKRIESLPLNKPEDLYQLSAKDALSMLVQHKPD